MATIKIDGSKEYFVDEKGRKFFYLADTIWSAFTNITIEEWIEYLDYRKAQGFNVLQIDILPQWDASPYDIGIQPFELKADGSWNFSNINEVYFDRAEEMVRLACERGFISALVILWCNYVPDTWSSKINPNNILPPDFVRPWVEYVADRFAKYNPIFIISGDTNFEGPKASLYYMTALNTIKEMYPQCLTTMHLSGGFWELPEEFELSKNLDFYMYQSGHGAESQDLVYKLAERFMGKRVKRPIVNGEPCYEGHAHGNKYGRFTRFDVRKAVWSSLLSGAKAGVTYGAHGIWSWHKKGKNFGSKGFSGLPYDWSTALRFEGAWDVSFAKWLFEMYDLFDLQPMQGIINGPESIRAAMVPNRKVAIYVPYAIDVEVSMDLSEYDIMMINLANRYIIKPDISFNSGRTILSMPQVNSDVVLLGVKP